MPAIPLTSDVTFVNSTLSSACSTLAFAARTEACGAELRLNLRIELALGDGPCLGQRRVALDIEAGLAELRLSLGQLRLRLIQGRLERPRINLEQHLAFPDDSTPSL